MNGIKSDNPIDQLDEMFGEPPAFDPTEINDEWFSNHGWSVGSGLSGFRYKALNHGQYAVLLSDAVHPVRVSIQYLESGMAMPEDADAYLDEDIAYSSIKIEFGCDLATALRLVEVLENINIDK